MSDLAGTKAPATEPMQSGSVPPKTETQVPPLPHLTEETGFFKTVNDEDVSLFQILMRLLSCVILLNAVLKNTASSLLVHVGFSQFGIFFNIFCIMAAGFQLYRFVCGFGKWLKQRK